MQYHIWEREYIILEILRKRLENFGMVVEYADYMDINGCIKFRPDVIITHPIRTETDVIFLATMKLATGAVMIPMTVEGYYDLEDHKSVIRMIGLDKCPVNLIDYFIMWGEKNKEIEGRELLNLQKISSVDKIKAFGYIPYEKEAVLEYVKHDEQYAKYVQWGKKYARIIACVTGFHIAEASMEDIYLQKIIGSSVGSKAYEREAHDYEMRIAYMKGYRDKYVNDILQLAKTFPDMGIVVKLHPAEISRMRRGISDYYEVLRDYDNIFLLDVPLPIAAVLNDAELLIHYGSTVSLEAYIYGKPTILRSAKGYIDENSNNILVYTTKVDINDYSLFQEEVINGVTFQKNNKAETILLDSFNWRPDMRYCPSEEMAKFISGDLHSEKLQIKELISQKFVSDDFVRSVRIMIYKYIIKTLIQFKFGQTSIYLRYAVNLMSGANTFWNDLIRTIKKRRHF